MLVIPTDDDALTCLRGVALKSPRARAVEYRVLRPLGLGGMSKAFLALRDAPEGHSPVVVKLLRPDFALEAGEMAILSVQKEITALARLGERVPPTPLVVRLIETGELEVQYAGRTLRLPWLGLEYVNGGAEGTTLLDRVANTVGATGAAFDALRAARAMDCLTRGVAAVHEVGVLHRDIKPANVLCCGFGDDELLKLADFGLARSSSVTATFGLEIGTPGYAPPELSSLDQRRIGPWTDVFGTACVMFYLLTGEHYFVGSNLQSLMGKIRSTKRRSLLEAEALSPDLRAKPHACRAIDDALARATAAKHEERTASVEALAASILTHLQADSNSDLARNRIAGLEATLTSGEGWTWSTSWRPGGDMAIRQLDWDGDACCLAVTTHGLAFWTGTEWRSVHVEGIGEGARVVRRAGPGRWLVGGGTPPLAICTFRGIEEYVEAPQDRGTIDLLHGDITDLAVMVIQSSGASFALHARVGRRWLRPVPVHDAAAITSIARVDDARWLVSGRRREGKSFALIYAPLEFSLSPIDTPPNRAMLASAGEPLHRLGLAVGTEGAVSWWEAAKATTENIPGGLNMSAAAIDVLGRGWAASPGCIWLRRNRTWTKVWHDSTWKAPFISLFVDPGLIVAITADGGVLEGRKQGFSDEAEDWVTYEST